ncbi:hypothetical protein EBR04_01405 [bacterium]|nr:hypothetical protein [bacterium]
MSWRFGFDVLDRVEQAVAMVKERLKRAVAALEAAGMPAQAHGLRNGRRTPAGSHHAMQRTATLRSDHCRARGIPQAAGRPDPERLRGDDEKNATPRGVVGPHPRPVRVCGTSHAKDPVTFS